MPPVSEPSVASEPSVTPERSPASDGCTPADPQPSWGGVAAFLALAYGLGWAAQIGLALAVRDDPAGPLQLGGGLLVVAVALMWPPALGAIVARRLVERGRGPGLGWRRGPWRYLLIGWLSPSLMTLAARALGDYSEQH